MKTRILSSALLAAIKPLGAAIKLGIAAQFNRAGRLVNKERREVKQRVENVMNSPALRAEFERREAIRVLLNSNYTPTELPAKSVSKRDRRAARAQLRETNKWATWRELARKRQAAREKALAELVETAQADGEYAAPV